MQKRARTGGAKKGKGRVKKVVQDVDENEHDGAVKEEDDVVVKEEDEGENAPAADAAGGASG